MRLWERLPVGRVVCLTGADPAALALMVASPPTGVPAVVTYRPRSAESTVDVVAAALDELESVALGLFPAWLPEASGIAGPGGAGAAAVRALALDVASRTGQFGPFLADLAESALRGVRSAGERFGAEIRAAGLARVIAGSYGRTAAALLVYVPVGLQGRWRACFGGWAGVAGPAWRSWGVAYGCRSVRCGVDSTGSGASARGGREDRAGIGSEPDPRPCGHFRRWHTRPSLDGPTHRARQSKRSRPRSARSRGRQGVRGTRPTRHAFSSRLCGWTCCGGEERCVVEIDGPEHAEPVRYEADRRRDRAAAAGRIRGPAFHQRSSFAGPRTRDWSD